MARLRVAAAAMLLAVAGQAAAVVTTTTSVAEYTCNGTTKTYSVPFKFLATSDLQVSRVLVAAPYTQTFLTLTTDYAVSGAGTDTGGQVVLVAPGTSCPSSSYKLRIRRATAKTQATKFSAYSAFPSKTVEATLDRVVMGIQEANDAALTAQNYDFTGPSASSALVTATGTSVARRLDVRMAQTLNVEDFGAAGDGSTDDQAAVQATLSAAVDGDTIVFPPRKTFLLASPVTVSKRVTIEGQGSGVMLGTNTGFQLTQPARIRGFRFDSTATGTSVAIGVYGVSDGISGTRVEGNRFGRVIVVLRDAVLDGTASITDVHVEGNSWDGDFTNATAGDTYNLIDARGIDGLFIIGNRFKTVNVERHMKVSGSCRHVTIANNVVHNTSGTNGKQSVDMYGDTRDATVTGNVWDLTGGFTACVENKNGAGSTDYAEPSEIAIVGNVCKLSRSDSTAIDPFGLYGAWGVTTNANDVAQPEGNLGRYTANVSNNLILLSGGSTTASPLILVRGFTHAIVSGNVLWRDTATSTFTAGLEVSNSRQTTIAGNQIEYGYIQVGGAASHPGGTTYTGQPDQVVITGNSVRAYKSQGGIFIVNATISDLNASGNVLATAATSGSNGHFFLSGSTVSRFTASGNSGTTDASDLVLSSSTITSYAYGRNAWQSGRATWNPGTVGSAASASTTLTILGAQVGDSVSLGLPYDSQGCTFLARVSSSNTVTITIWNFTGAGKTFASGTWEVAVSRN